MICRSRGAMLTCALIVELVFAPTPTLSADNYLQVDARFSLNIHAAHYAKKGHQRLGTAGYGEFMGFTFGTTNSCCVLPVEKLEGTNRVWQVAGKLPNPYRGFVDVTLYHDARSRKLFKIAVSRKFGPETDIAVITRTLKSCSDDCDDWLGIRVPVAFHTKCTDESQKEAILNQRFWCSRKEDGQFAIEFVMHRKESMTQVEIAVESKRVRRGTTTADGRNDVDVQVEGL